MEESVDVHLAYQRIWAIHGVFHHLFTSQIWPILAEHPMNMAYGRLSPPFSSKVHHENPKKSSFGRWFSNQLLGFIGSSHKFLRVHTWLPNRLTTCFPFVAHLLVGNPLNFRSLARWRSIENDMFHHLCNVLVAYQAPAVEMTRNPDEVLFMRGREGVGSCEVLLR